MNTDLNWFKSCLQDNILVEKLKKIKLIVTDVDGCLTNGQLFITENGDRIKGFSVQDGFATTKALKSDLLISFLTGRKDNSVKYRAKQLGIPDDLYFEGFCDGKKEIIKQIQKNKNISKEQTILFGDDFLDIECKDEVGIFASPQNSLFYVASQADLIIPKQGGFGAFRLLLDLILFIQEKHFASLFINKTIK
ncbi:MAG: hypothetical protein ABIA74_01550 [bacterium]